MDAEQSCWCIERWLRLWSFSLSTFLSFCVSICLFVYYLPSIYLCFCLSHLSFLYLPVYLSVYLPSYLSINLSIDLSICLSLFVYHPVYLSIYLSIYLSVYLSIYLSMCLTESLKTKLFCETYLKFRSWPPLKNEACLGDFLHLHLPNIKHQPILRDALSFWTWPHQKLSNSARLPSKIESWVQSWWPRTCAFCDLSIPFV